MQYRLEAPHFINDMYLEKGTVVGDDTGIPYRYPRASNTVRPDGKRVRVNEGDPMSPSIAMFPLDAEAKAAYKEKFGDTPDDPDPVERIPVMGNVKSTEHIQPGQSPIRGAVGPTTDPNRKPGDKPSTQPKPGEAPKPGAPDNRSPGPGGPQTGQAPPSPAPSGPGSGKEQNEEKK
jgi:hypothetical protein